MSVTGAQQRVVRAEQAVAAAEAELTEARAARDTELAAAGWLRLPIVGRNDLYENLSLGNPMLPVDAVVALVESQAAAA